MTVPLEDLKERQSKQMATEFVVWLNVLEASCTNSVDSSQTAPIGAA